MAKFILINITSIGNDIGPLSLYSDVDAYTTPFETNIPRSSFIGGYISEVVPIAATIIRVQSTGACTDFIDITIDVGTTTTTSTLQSYYVVDACIFGNPPYSTLIEPLGINQLYIIPGAPDLYYTYNGVISNSPDIYNPNITIISGNFGCPP